MFFNLFLSPKEQEARMLRHAKSVLQDKKPFDELPKRRPTAREDVGIIASTFKPENPLDEIFPRITDGKQVTKGNLRYLKKKLPFGHGLQILGAEDLWSEAPQAFFDEDVYIAVLQHRVFDEGSHKWRVWMSITPYEIWTQTPALRTATGHVVLGGLGMGWLLRQVAAKPEVTEITVVEKDAALLDWYGLRLCASTPKVRQVICSDIYDAAEKMNLEDRKFIIDIWDEWHGAECDEKLQALRDRGAKVWAWGSATNPRGRWRHDDPRRSL